MRASVAILGTVLGLRALGGEPGSGEAQDPADSALSIPGDQLRDVPGTWGDPLRALARFPGATTVVGGLGPLVVRGLLPDATPTFIDGVRVSWPFHALVGPAALSPELVDRVDYYRGEAPARFGLLTGGAIDIHLPERAQGAAAFADVDLLTARATAIAAVGPLGTRVLASAGALWTPWLFSRLTPAVEANLADWQLSVAQPLGRGELRLLWLGAYDGAGLTQGTAADGLLQPYSFAQPLSQTQRVDLRWRSGDGLEASATYGLDRLALRAGGAVNETVLDAAERTFGARVRWRKAAGERGKPVTFELGAEVERHRADYELGALVSPPGGAVTAVDFRGQASGVFAGAWAQLTGTSGGLTVTPGVRVSTAHLAFHDTEVAFEPRLWVDSRSADGYEVHGGAGWYHQPATTLVPLPGFSLEHLPQGMSSVLQASAGVTLHPQLGVDLSIDGYWDPLLRTVEASALSPSTYQELLASPADPAAQPSAGSGTALGLEVLLRKPLGDRLTGWISYSVQRSWRSATPPAFAFDQTHVVNAVLAYRLPFGWTVSGAALVRSGAPESGSLIAPQTERQGTDASGAPAWVPVTADQLDRLPGLIRLDARAAKAFDLDPLRLEVWLDVFDVNLARDAYGNGYGVTLDASGQRTLTKGQTGLWYPLPMLGVRAAFRP